MNGSKPRQPTKAGLIGGDFGKGKGHFCIRGRSKLIVYQLAAVLPGW
jgi:hypothetical protein